VHEEGQLVPPAHVQVGGHAVHADGALRRLFRYWPAGHELDDPPPPGGGLTMGQTGAALPPAH
jgi:hypothetical protein